MTDGIRDDLTGAAALSQPDPPLVLAERDERPKFIEFQHIIRLGLNQRLVQRRQLAGFF